MTDSIGNVLVGYLRFLEYQDRRLKIAGELARLAEPPTGETVALQTSHDPANDRSVESGSVLTDRSRPTASPAGRISGRRQAVDSTDGSQLH
jgi:hypothetical protein